jgi:penicillin-binding protein 2
MNWKRLFFVFIFLGLVACGQDSSLLPQDSYDIVTLTPLPTDTPLPTAEPIKEEASGIGRAFFRAWEGGDYLGMYSLLSPKSQALIESQSFIERYEEAMETATVQAISSQPLSIVQENDQASFRVRVALETAVVGTITRDFIVPLSYQEGRWGVVWDEGLILPELGGGYHLYMQHRRPARANIYDINGLALAYQGTVVSLGIIPGQIEDEEGLLDALAPVVGKTPAEIQELYASALPDWYVPIGDVREETMQEHTLDLEPYIGAGLAQPTTRLGRLYSEEGTAPHIVGYTGFIPEEEVADYKAEGFQSDEQVGRAGLEQWGEDYLNGERGGTLTVVGANGEYITTIQESDPRQARSLYTTINRDFQAAVEGALSEAINGVARAGSVVVLDVNTGAVRAMASYPTYNPFVFDSVRPNAAAELVVVLSDPGQPLLNMSTQGAYPTGSLFKIITMSAALNSGVYTANTYYTSTGSWSRLGDAYIKYDWREGGHGTVSLRQALVVSCNTCFYDVGYNLDEFDSDFLPQTARQFGLGSTTGIQLQESAGLIPGPEWKIQTQGEGWARGDAVNMAIGQGFVQVTPLQMVDVLAAIANGGTLYQPTVVDRIGAGAGAPEEPWPVQERGQLPLSAEHLGVLQESLWNVANSSSGTAAHQFVGLPVPVAGKTGTAEAPPRGPHAWFAGYAPAAPYTLADGSIIEEPEIAIVVMIEHAGEGSAVAAPIFRRVVELYYDITPVTPFPWGN